MPNLLITDPNDNDGTLGKSIGTDESAGTDSFIDVRSSTTGQYQYITNTNNAAGAAARTYTWGAGAANRQMWLMRAFFIFDTSGITVAPSAATFKIYGYSSWSDDAIAVRHDAPSPLYKNDWDKIYNCTTELADTDGEGNGTLASCATNYSAVVTSGTTSGYNDFVLTSTALDQMASEDSFKIAIMQYDNDYLDITPYPSNSSRCGMYFTEDTDGGRDPYIDYTEGYIEPVIFTEVESKGGDIDLTGGSLKIG